MHKLNRITRRSALQALAGAPLLTVAYRSARAAGVYRWTITGERVEKLDGLDAAMQRFMRQYGVRAGSLAVARQGRILFERAYTWAEADYPVTQPNSPFRLASVSKLFTAALVYELIQAKALDADLKVFPWLGYEHAMVPGQHVDPRLKTITVQHLVDHRGGWNSDISHFDPVFRMRDIARRLGLHRGPSGADIARFMVGEPLQFPPGSQDHYSNFGYLMLGLAAEKAGNGEYLKLVHARVTAQLGIDGVFAAHTRKEQRLPAEGYYDQPGFSSTPEFPDRDVQMPLAYGGEGWLTESMQSAGGLAATASAVARTIGHYVVWGFGLRRSGQTWIRTGSMAGTSSYAISRPGGLDFCFIVNTRNFANVPDGAPVDKAGKEINAVLDTFRDL